MATSVAPVDHRSSTTQVDSVEQASARQDRGFAFLLVSALTLVALAVQGYHPYADDGGLYLAGVKRLLIPALYPHSAAFALEPTRFSLFAPAVASIVRVSHLTLPVILLALHLASIWATLFTAWMLACRCWSTRPARAGAVALLACWLGLPVAGTALVLMDPYLTARSISSPCMVLSLIGALDFTDWSWPATKNFRRRGLYLWIASIALGATMHPLMAAYALGATLMLACARSSRLHIRVWATASFSTAALVIAACLQHAAKPESADYRRIALTRTYWFPAAWSWYELVGLVAPLAMMAIFAWRTSWPQPRADDVRAEDVRRALAQMAVAVGATAWLIGILFARADAATHLIARMQPLRVFQIVYLIMVLRLGAAMGRLVLRSNARRWAAAILLLSGTMFSIERGAFSHSQHLEFPWTAPRNQWVQAFVWIRDNTPKQALFALDADYINAHGEDAQCFRAIAERSSLPDYSKDGGEASIAPELTAAWKVGQQAQHRLSDPLTTDTMRVAALVSLGVSWIVLDTKAATNSDCPYANAAVKVCRMP